MQHADQLDVRHGSEQQLHVFLANLPYDVAQSGHHATWARETLHPP